MNRSNEPTAKPWPHALPARAKPPGRVVVLGAGLAGLVAAYELRLLGHDVRVLEARARPGGRIETLRAPFSAGLHAEAGAMFVPSNHTIAMQTLAYFEAALVQIPPDHLGYRYFVRGVRVDDASDLASWPVKLTRTPLQAWTATIAPLLAPLSTDLPAHGWVPVLDRALAPYCAQTIRELLVAHGITGDELDIVRLGYLSEWGDGIDVCSAGVVMRDAAVALAGRPGRLGHFAPTRSGERSGGGTRGANASVGGERGAGAGSPPPTAPVVYTVRDGTDALPAAFAATAELRDRIAYEHAVVALRAHEDGITVTCEHGGRTTDITADRVICTLPFPVLRELALDVPLSAGKAAAIRTLRTTSVTRVMLEFSTRTWDVGETTGLVLTDLPIMFLNDQTINQPGEAGILEAYVTGANARALQALTAEARIRDVLAQIEQVFPGISASFTTGTSKCWDEDPWARGDYCWFTCADMTTMLPHLATAEGALHFAGEHTSPVPGWMEGALQSGQRAAREVHAAL